MQPKTVILIVLALLTMLGTAHASSVSASFNIVNGTVSINQLIYFNISADFPTQTNYTIFLNNTAIMSGNISANDSKYNIIGYNVSDIPYGRYNSDVYFSAFNLRLSSSNKLYVNQLSNFIFIGDTNITEITKNYSYLDIKIKNVGNTPLYMNWTLPILRNISISVNYQQNFAISPGENKTIPINLTLGKGYQNNVSFAFTGTYENYFATKYYYTDFIKPNVNMSFYNINISKVNTTVQLWTSYIRNYNNVPVTLFLKFTLNVNGSTLYYTKNYVLPVNATEIQVFLPKSTVENVQVSYSGSNSSTITESVFTAPTQPFKLSLPYIVNNLGYAIFTLAAVFLLVLIHMKLGRKKGNKKNGIHK
jgi:hypothetical protein